MKLYYKGTIRQDMLEATLEVVVVVVVKVVLFAFFFSLCWAYTSGWYSPLCPVIMFIKLCLTWLDHSPKMSTLIYFSVF